MNVSHIIYDEAEVNQIIGFAPNNELKNGRYVWEDSSDRQRIEIRFRNGRIAQMKSVRF